MDFFDLINVAQSVAARIDVQWGFFLTIHMALLGGIIYVDRPLSLVEKSVATIIYLVFATFNFRLIRQQQRLLESAYADIVGLKDDACCAASNLMNFYVSEVEGGFAERIQAITVSVHLLAVAVVLLSIVADRAKRR